MNDETFYSILKGLFVLGEIVFGLSSVLENDLFLLIIAMTCLILSFICTVIIKLERQKAAREKPII